uniref:Transposase DDE domain-containing protein n=1 Tax=Romanomermis culicivorax TaxID=13658 RepID=A0A915JVE1_ROMCU
MSPNANKNWGPKCGAEWQAKSRAKMWDKLRLTGKLEVFYDKKHALVRKTRNSDENFMLRVRIHKTTRYGTEWNAMQSIERNPTKGKFSFRFGLEAIVWNTMQIYLAKYISLGRARRYQGQLH